MFESFKQISSITSPLKFFEKNYSKEGLEALYVDYLSRMPKKMMKHGMEKTLQ